MMVMDDTTSSTAQATQLSRHQIMEATAQCVREQGYDATTIRRIASQLDCAVGSIYRYFDDKRDLLDAVAQAAMEPSAQLIEAGASVEESARLYHDLATRDPALYRLMFWISAIGTQTPATTDNTDIVPNVITRLIVGWGKRLGDEPLARRCWMMLHGCVTLGLSSAEAITMLRSLSQPASPAAVKETLSTPPRNLRAVLPSLAPIVVTTTPVMVSRVESVEAKDEEARIAAESQAAEDVVLL